MADLLTSDQKAKLRADGHKSKFYLSVVKPSVLLSAQVNGAQSRGAISIPFDGGTSPGVGLIRAGQTVKVTTSFGTFATRLASFTSSGSSPNLSGTITTDPNSYQWPDNAQVTIEDMHDPRSIPPEFDATTGVSKKRSQVFANQTVKPGPLLRMGGHKAKFLVGGSAVFDLNAVGVPVAPGATISSYLWQCSEGVIASPSSQNTTITFTTPGGRWVYCTVTDSNSKTEIAARYYWTPDSDPESVNYPYTEFQANSIGTGFDGGGQLSLTVSGVADFTEFRDGALLLIWRRAWFGSVEGPISLSGSDTVLYSGYIVKDTVNTNAEHGTVQFEVQSPWGLMKSLPMQALSIHAEQIIQYWFQTDRRMTLIMILQWLLRWHSNLLTVFEWNVPTGGLYKKLYSFNEGTLGQMVQDIASKYVCGVGCDRAGIMYVERNINTLDTADRDAKPVVSDITKADWRDQQVIVRRGRRMMSAVKVSGFYYDGANELTPYCSIAPTKIRETAGQNPTGFDGLVLASQSDANMLSGRFLAINNSPIEEVRVNFAGDYSVCDVFPQRWWRMSLAAGDTPRGIEMTDQRLVPRSVSLTLDAAAGHLGVDAVFEPEAFGPNGTSDPCPNTGTVTQTPEESAPPGGASLPASDAAALATVSSLRFLAHEGDEWAQYSQQLANDGALDPFWKIKANGVDPLLSIYWLVGNGGVVQRVVSGTNWVYRNLTTDPPNSWSDATAPTVETTILARIASSVFKMNTHYVAANYYTGSLWRAWLVKTSNDFQAFAWHTLFQASDVQTKLLGLAEDQQDGSILWLTCWRNGTLWLEKWDTTTMTRTSSYNLGSATLSEIDSLTYVAEVAAAPGDKNLVYVFGRLNAPVGLAGVQHIIRSTNGGTGWSSVESGWGTDHCAAFAVGLLENNSRNMVAVRRPAPS